MNLPSRFLLRSTKAGFTLVELLVVMAIIVILAGMLIPTLAGGKERARRVSCKNNVRQFLVGLHIYANDNENVLPSGLSENSNSEDEHTPIISTQTQEALVRTTGSAKVLMCPWLGKPFTQTNGWHYESYGYVIGYNYLGGHEGTPWPVIGAANEQWTSPKKINSDGSVPIVTELNAWSLAEGKTFAPHGVRGAILEQGDSSNQGSGGIPSAKIGAAGGNIGRLDGSVSWKKMNQMKIHRGSRLWEDEGCYTAW